MNNTQKIIAAVFTGLAAGIVAGILFAPDKGSETRRKIANTSKKVADNVKEFTQNGASVVSDYKDKLIKKKNEFADNLADNNRS